MAIVTVPPHPVHGQAPYIFDKGGRITRYRNDEERDLTLDYGHLSGGKPHVLLAFGYIDMGTNRHGHRIFVTVELERMQGVYPGTDHQDHTDPVVACFTYDAYDFSKRGHNRDVESGAGVAEALSHEAMPTSTGRSIYADELASLADEWHMSGMNAMCDHMREANIPREELNNLDSHQRYYLTNPEDPMRVIPMEEREYVEWGKRPPYLPDNAVMESFSDAWRRATAHINTHCPEGFVYGAKWLTRPMPQGVQDRIRWFIDERGMRL